MKRQRYLDRLTLTTIVLSTLWIFVAVSTSRGEGWERKSSTKGDLQVPNGGDQQTCCVAADIDGDGVDDFIVGERTKAPSIVWYKLNGRKWDRHIIDDGLLDLLVQ